MEIKDIVAIIIGLAAAVGIIVYLVINQKQKVIEWLKYAVLEAEKYLGGGTGQLKLRTVYSWFCEKFSVLAVILPFEVFSAWVDVALETMHNWLETNQNIAGYAEGKPKLYLNRKENK